MNSRALWYALAGLVWAAIPAIALAQGGIVPCGWAGGPDGGAIGCNLCYVSKLIENIITFLIITAIPLSTALFAWAGWLYFTSGANPSQTERARKIFSSVFLGFVIALGGWLLVQTVLKALLSEKEYKGWGNIQCDSAERLEQTNKDVKDLVKLLPGFDSRPRAIPTDSAPTTNYYCGYGYYQDGSTCDNESGDRIPANITTCPAGSNWRAEAYVCEACTDDGSGGGESCDIVAPLGSRASSGYGTIDGGTPTLSERKLDYAIAGTEKYQQRLQDICAQEGVTDCKLAQAIMAIESNGKVGAYSSMGAAGLMQVIPSTARMMDKGLASYSDQQIKSILTSDPDYAMKLGVRYINQLQNQFNDPVKVIAAYNGGPGANGPAKDCKEMTKWQCPVGRGGYQETFNYVANVSAAYNKLK